MSTDRISAFVIGVAFSCVVYFAGMAKGESSITNHATNDLLARQAQIMTVSECLGLLGKNSRGK